MNSKNILITIGVIGIGFVLYKFLLGFVLPIALFVSLRYVLKFLLKGSDSKSGEEVSQILTKNSVSTPSIENIVEIKPIKEEAPKEEAPKEEAPKEEAPKEEAPKEEAPKEEAPKEEAPKEEENKTVDGINII